jgi:hypothetical protein
MGISNIGEGFFLQNGTQIVRSFGFRSDET